VELLPRYAHFQANSADRTWPVGQKRPNDLGLFDLHGNVWNWCQDETLNYPRRNSAQPNLDILRIDASSSRNMRGGSFFSHAPYVRASYRNDGPPDIGDSSVGLRVCRTCD
jgi:formylglycine-generating enzyme required for sulfatase activity